MATIPNETLDVEALGDLPEEVRRPLETVSRFMKAVRSIVNGGLKHTDNLGSVVKTVPIRLENLPSIVDLGKEFREQPTLLWVGRVDGGDGAALGYPQWEPAQLQADDGMHWGAKVKSIPGLSAGISYRITFIVSVG
jgi:hypothetical protein